MTKKRKKKMEEREEETDLRGGGGGGHKFLSLRRIKSTDAGGLAQECAVSRETKMAQENWVGL